MLMDRLTSGPPVRAMAHPLALSAGQVLAALTRGLSLVAALLLIVLLGLVVTGVNVAVVDVRSPRGGG